MASTTILSDNGASSGSAGIKTTGGNDGVLILQTTTSGGTATNALQINTSQNVGIGITPSATGSGYTSLQVRSANLMSDSAATVLYNNAYYTGSVEKYIATGYANKLVLNAAANGSMVLYGTSSGSAGADITFTNILQVNKDATVALQGGTSSSGTGIAFPATQSASTNANTLDDYEEGSWTPVFEIGGVDSGATWAVKTGSYTKIGRTVMIWAYLYSSTGRGSGSGVVRITGLPFATENTSLSNYHVVDARAGISWSGGGAGLPFTYQPANTTYMQFYSTANSTSSGTSGLTEANFSAAGTLEINLMLSYLANN